MGIYERGRFGFDGAEGHAFWVYSDDTHEEAQATIEFSDLKDLKLFLEENVPGLFTPTAESNLRDDLRAYAADRAFHAKHPTLNTVGSVRIASDLFQMLGLPYPEGEDQ